VTTSSFDRVIDRSGTASFKWDKYPPGTINLWVADMDFASPPPVVAALGARAAHGVFGYTRIPESLVEAVVDRLAARYGWQVDPEWIVWLPGVTAGFNLACRAFADEGETVMTVSPMYPPILKAPPLQGRRLLAVPATVRDGRWRLPLGEMEAAVTPDTRLFIFCHPHNPVGRAFSRDEIAAVTAFCRRHDLVLCSDEIHCDLLLDPVEHLPSVVVDPEMAARSVTLMSPSKTFNLPGLQFAFAVIPDADMRERFRAPGGGLVEFLIPGAFATVAAEAAYREGGPWLAELLDYLRGNRDLLERFVASELPKVTMTHVEATYLAWLDVSATGLDDPFAACLAAGVALSDGGDFAGHGSLRLNFACPRSVLVEALDRLRGVLGQGAVS
jgi:cystathionine beta-lyase